MSGTGHENSTSMNKVEPQLVAALRHISKLHEGRFLTSDSQDIVAYMVEELTVGTVLLVIPISHYQKMSMLSFLVQWPVTFSLAVHKPCYY